MAANRKPKPRPSKGAKAESRESDALSTDRQRAFVEHYCQCWSATEAAKRAGYSEKTAQEQGSRLLSKVMVQKAITVRVAELKMTTDEVLLRLAQHARGSMEDLLDGEDELSLAEARKRGRLHLVKKLKHTRRTDKDGGESHSVEAELYDAQAALVQLGRAHGLFVDKVAPTDPTGTKEYASGLTDEERQRRVAELLDAARARRA